MSHEEIIERLEKKYFSVEAEKYARKHLKLEKVPRKETLSSKANQKGFSWWYVLGLIILIKIIVLIVNKVLVNSNLPHY